MASSHPLARACARFLEHARVMACGKIARLRRGTRVVRTVTALLAAPQRVLTREQLLGMSHLHNDEVYDRAIDTQIARLRKKLEEHGAADELIHTERGIGYVFTAAVEVVR